ncbi:MAG TPA: TolC family protein [Bacteroidales bacterium]|nr:TolC family protein [Bacteroidales bacterium]
MKKMIKTAICSLTFLVSVSVVFSQEPGILKRDSLGFSPFMTAVSKGNLGYISQQFNVSIAQAKLTASKVFPDPQISIAYSNNQDKTLMMGQSVDGGISYPVNLGNKRGASVSLAASQLDLAHAELTAFFQALRADAAKGYFQALRNLKIYEMQKDNLVQLNSLARADSLRLSKGEGSSIDAKQSSLEARAFRGEVYNSLSDLQNASAELSRLTGKRPGDTLILPTGNFPDTVNAFELSDLVNKALTNRADLIVALKGREVSEKNLRLISATRSPEVNINAGYSHNYIAKNTIAPAPAYNAITAGIDFPLKFSSLNRGSLDAARFSVKQAESAGKDVEIQIISEVTEAYNRFMACKKKADLYRTGIISDAEKILSGRTYSYQHGETGLVDVLNAQRSYIELGKNYIDAKFELACALIDLEYAAGIWDLGGK